MKIKDFNNNKINWLKAQIDLVRSSVLFTKDEAEAIIAPLKAELQKIENRAATNNARLINVNNPIELMADGVR